MKIMTIMTIIMFLALGFTSITIVPKVAQAAGGSIWTTDEDGEEQDGNVIYDTIDDVWFEGANFDPGDYYVKVEALAGGKKEWMGTKQITVSDGIIQNTQLISVVPFEAGYNEYKVYVSDNSDFTNSKQDNFKVKEITPPQPETPQIAISKTASVTTLPASGGQVTYTYSVTNPGTVDISSVEVTDDKISTLSDVSGDTNENNILEPTETWEYTASANLTETTTNIATVTGVGNDQTVTASATATVTVSEAPPPPVDTPQIAISKTASVETLPASGGSVTYKYTVTNPGTVGLTSIVVTDDKIYTVTYVAGDANANAILEPTETWEYTASANLTATTTNIATVTGVGNDQTVTASATATVTVSEAPPQPETPQIAISKTASVTTLPASGGQVTYTYTVTNPGTVDLNSVEVTDDKINTVTYVSGDANENTILEPTETWEYTGSANLTATTTNIATVTGVGNDQEVTASATATVTVRTRSGGGGTTTNPPGTLEVIKTIEGGGPQAEITFKLFKGETIVATGITDTNGVILFTGLAPGTDYHLEELVPPNFKTDLDKNASITILSDKKTSISVINSPPPPPALEEVPVTSPPAPAEEESQQKPKQLPYTGGIPVIYLSIGGTLAALGAILRKRF